jgi:hypothetical protein
MENPTFEDDEDIEGKEITVVIPSYLSLPGCK